MFKAKEQIKKERKKLKLLSLMSMIGRYGDKLTKSRCIANPIYIPKRSQVIKNKIRRRRQG